MSEPIDAPDTPHAATPAPAVTAAEPRAPLEVVLLVRDAPWNAGDVVTLPAPAAEKLIRHGVAEVTRTQERRGGRAGHI
jgi:hypothetical protein